MGQSAQQALTLADAADLETVDTEAALEALAKLGLDADLSDDRELDGHDLNQSAAIEKDEAMSFRVPQEIRKTA